MQKTLSISIAAYNVEAYLNELLQRLTSSQRLEQLEILVFDDGSTDRTLEIGQRFEKQHPSSVRVVHKENGGYGSTVNLGIRLATGKYFKLLDGDDFYDVKELDQLIDYLARCETDAILTPYLKFYDNSDSIETSQNQLFAIEQPKIIKISDIPVNPFTLEMYSLTFRTSLLKDADIEITENCFYTDNEYVVKSVSQCQTFSVAPFCVYQYRSGRMGQSVSLDGMKKHYKEFEFILKKMLLYTRDTIDDVFLKEIFFQRFCGLSYYYFELLFGMGAQNEYRSACKEYDIWLKKEFPVLHKGIKYIPLLLFRLTRYHFFSIIRFLR